MTIIGVPTEIKQDEHRVAMTPAGAHSLTGEGPWVIVQSGVGEGSGMTDAQYEAASGRLVRL